MSDDLRATSIGYAINYTLKVSDKKNLSVSGTLPLGATLEEFNAELDKIRATTDRMDALTDRQNLITNLAVARKTRASLEHMVEAIDKEFEDEIKGLQLGETKNHTATKNLINSMRGQASQQKMEKKSEILKLDHNIEVNELYLEKVEKIIAGKE